MRGVGTSLALPGQCAFAVGWSATWPVRCPALPACVSGVDFNVFPVDAEWQPRKVV
jgi:hypothetical protein